MEGSHKANGEAMGLVGAPLIDQLDILHGFAEVAERFNPGFANYE